MSKTTKNDTSFIIKKNIKFNDTKNNSFFI